MSLPALITNSMLYEKLEEIEKLLKKVIGQQAINCVDEVSLRKTRLILRIGEPKIIEYIEEGSLKARKVQCNKATLGYSYRIRLSDIKEFQENYSYVRNVEPSDISDILAEIDKEGAKLEKSYKRELEKSRRSRR